MAIVIEVEPPSTPAPSSYPTLLDTSVNPTPYFNMIMPIAMPTVNPSTSSAFLLLSESEDNSGEDNRDEDNVSAQPEWRSALAYVGDDNLGDGNLGDDNLGVVSLFGEDAFSQLESQITDTDNSGTGPESAPEITTSLSRKYYKTDNIVEVDGLHIDLTSIQKRSIPLSLKPRARALFPFGNTAAAAAAAAAAAEFRIESKPTESIPTGRQAPVFGYRRIFLQDRNQRDQDPGNLDQPDETISTDVSGESETDRAGVAQSDEDESLEERKLSVSTASVTPSVDFRLVANRPTRSNNAICLIRVGNTFALPVSTHYGNKELRGSNFSFTTKNKIPQSIGTCVMRI